MGPVMEITVRELQYNPASIGNTQVLTSCSLLLEYGQLRTVLEINHANSQYLHNISSLM